MLLWLNGQVPTATLQNLLKSLPRRVGIIITATFAEICNVMFEKYIWEWCLGVHKLLTMSFISCPLPHSPVMVIMGYIFMSEQLFVLNCITWPNSITICKCRWISKALFTCSYTCECIRWVYSYWVVFWVLEGIGQDCWCSPTGRICSKYHSDQIVEQTQQLFLFNHVMNITDFQVWIGFSYGMKVQTEGAKVRV